MSQNQGARMKLSEIIKSEWFLLVNQNIKNAIAVYQAFEFKTND